MAAAWRQRRRKRGGGGGVSAAAAEWWRWRQQRRLAGSVEALGQGCEVWASLLMPLGTVVVEEERRRIAKMFQGIGGGEDMGAP